MSAIVSIPELPRRRDSEESLLLDSRISNFSHQFLILSNSGYCERLGIFPGTARKSYYRSNFV